MKKTKSETKNIVQREVRTETQTSKEVEIINVRIPPELISFLDQLIENGLYKTRSEAIREFVRDYINNRRTKDEGI